MPLLLLALAGGLRFVRIDEPRRIMFDEHHYVPDSREYLDRGVEVYRPAHPPLAKWLIAGSIAAFGDRPIGWRFAPAVSGMVVVGATYMLGRRLFRPLWPAALAGFLIAVDGLSLTMSRIAMLDEIQAAFVAMGALFIVLDRQTGDRRWRWATGLSLGLAVAVKWSSAPVLAVAIVAAMAAELSTWPKTWLTVRRAARQVVVPLVLVPVAAYVLTYAGWFANFERSQTGRERCAPSCTVADMASGWAFEQWDMWAVQRRLKATHPDRSRPVTWLALGHPVLYYGASCLPPNPPSPCEIPLGTRGRIVGLGNPALWWPALPAFAYVAWRAIRRERRAMFLLACAAGQVLPWFASWKPGFEYYLTPVAPFFALALALALADGARRWPRAHFVAARMGVSPAGSTERSLRADGRASRVGRADQAGRTLNLLAYPLVLLATATVVVVAVAAVIWFYPVWAAWPLPPSEIHRRLLFPFWRR